LFIQFISGKGQKVGGKYLIHIHFKYFALILQQKVSGK